MSKIAPQLAMVLKEDPKSTLVLEPKYDGIRLIWDKHDGTLDIYTRTFHDQRGKLPHLEEAFLKMPFDFILDGEIVDVVEFVDIGGQQVPIGNFSGAQSVIGSSVNKAARGQKVNGSHQLMFIVFDCLNAQGKNLMDLPDALRRNAAEIIVDGLRSYSKNVMLTPRWSRWDETFYEELVGRGGEGVILKNPLAIYHPGQRPVNTWYKVKARETADVVIMGYKPGQGKYKGLIGAVEFGQYRNGTLVPRSRCSGMTDRMRVEFSKNGGKYLGKVMEIRYFGRVGPEKSFRHPNFVAIRDDKDAEECVWD